MSGLRGYFSTTSHSLSVVTPIRERGGSGGGGIEGVEGVEGVEGFKQEYLDAKQV